MHNLSKEDLEFLIETFRGKSIILLGELHLNVDIYGKVTGISNGRTPIIQAARKEYSFGSAGDLAIALKKAGVNVYITGIIGEDANGQIIKDEFIKAGIVPSLLIVNKEARMGSRTRAYACSPESAENKQERMVLEIKEKGSAPLNESIKDSFKNVLELVLENMCGVVIIGPTGSEQSTLASYILELREQELKYRKQVIYLEGN